MNTFHDYLEDDPDIAWTTRNFEGGDKVGRARGATAPTPASPASSSDSHMPDVYHVNNANMFTPPDGQSPRMQMYLFTSLTGNFATDPTPDVNGGDDATVVYHEYAHGLSNRLITYADGWGALDAFQSGAMGEAWSDWYAMDFLVGAGLRAEHGRGRRRQARPLRRQQPADAPHGGSRLPGRRRVRSACPGGDDTGPQGGYTYGDMGHVWSGGPEVHADGEIWAQTLWDLRTAVGVSDARFLVTEAMRLSPPEPVLPRHAQRDPAGEPGRRPRRPPRSRGGHLERLRSPRHGLVRRHARTPTTPRRSRASRFLRTRATASARSRARSRTPTRASRSPAPRPVRRAPLVDTTDALGQYAIADVPVGTYPQVVASQAGYDLDIGSNVDVVADTEGTLDFALRRDWAAFAGGGRISAFTGPTTRGFGCGPTHAIDQSSATGWSTVKPNLAPAGPRSITVKLPSFVDVELLRGRPGRRLRRPGDRLGPGLPDRDVHDRRERLLDGRHVRARSRSARRTR